MITSGLDMAAPCHELYGERVLHLATIFTNLYNTALNAGIAQLLERILAKDEARS